MTLQPHKFLVPAYALLLCILIGCTPPPSPSKDSPQTYETLIPEIRKLISAEMKKTGTVGLAVAIVDSNKVIFSEGFGFADKAAKKPVTTKTGFCIGSVSKLFTATAIMQLVEQGKVVLDSPITTYLPEFKIKSSFPPYPITIRDMLCHESGLPSDVGYGFVLGQKRSPVVDTAYRTLVAKISDAYIAHPPRTTFAYSNAAISLLGIVIERVSGRSYAEYIHSEIMDVTGMPASSVLFDHPRTSANVAKGYLTGEASDPIYIRDIAAGAIFSCSDDMAEFVKMILARGSRSAQYVLQQSTIEQMWQQQNSGIPLDLDFSVGLTYWLSNPTRIPSRIVYHGGDLPPYHAFCAALPDAQLGIVVFVNAERGALLPTTLGTKLLERCYEVKYGKLLPENKPPAHVVLEKAKLDSLTGDYTSIFGYSKIQRAEKTLQMTMSGFPVTLIPVADTLFVPEIKLFGFINVPLDMLKNLTVSFHSVQEKRLFAVRFNGVGMAIGEKIELKEPPAAWIARAGIYTINKKYPAEYHNKSIKKRYDSDKCLLGYDKKTKMLYLGQPGLPTRSPIEAISDTVALTRGISRSSGETITGYAANGDEYLRMSGIIFKRMR